MQTFIPLKSFAASAAALDRQRLGKQRSEVLGILRANAQGPLCLFRPEPGSNRRGSYVYGPVPDAAPPGYKIRKTPWYNHPAAVMWRGYETALADYGLAVCAEWIGRSYRDTCYDKIAVYAQDDNRTAPLPPWWGGAIHASHRAALLAKAPEWYGQFGWREAPGIDYIWPEGRA